MPDTLFPGGGAPPVVASGEAPGSLKRLAVRGAIWTMFGFGANHVLRLGFNLIVTRLLYPDLFGLMSLVFTIVMGLTFFSDVGVAPAVIRDPRGDDRGF